MARKIKLRWEKPVKKHLPRWCGTCKYINVIVGPNCLAIMNTGKKSHKTPLKIFLKNSEKVFTFLTTRL